MAHVGLIVVATRGCNLRQSVVVLHQSRSSLESKNSPRRLGADAQCRPEPLAEMPPAPANRSSQFLDARASVTASQFPPCVVDLGSERAWSESLGERLVEDSEPFRPRTCALEPIDQTRYGATPDVTKIDNQGRELGARNPENRSHAGRRQKYVHAVRFGVLPYERRSELQAANQRLIGGWRSTPIRHPKDRDRRTEADDQVNVSGRRADDRARWQSRDAKAGITADVRAQRHSGQTRARRWDCDAHRRAP